MSKCQKNSASSFMCDAQAYEEQDDAAHDNKRQPWACKMGEHTLHAVLNLPLLAILQT